MRKNFLIVAGKKIKHRPRGLGKVFKLGTKFLIAVKNKNFKNKLSLGLLRLA